MRAAYAVRGVNSTTVRALNYTPEIDRMRNLSGGGDAAPLGRLTSDLGETYAKVLARVDCSREYGKELLGQVDIFGDEPRGRVIRSDLISFANKLEVRRWDILIAGVGQLGETTLFGRAIIADRRLEGKLVAGDVLVLRFPDPGSRINLFVYAFLNSRIGLRAIRSCAYGTSIPRIRLDLLSSLPVPLPDETLQERVAQFVRRAVESRETYLGQLSAARKLIEDQPDMIEARQMCLERKARCLIRDGAMKTIQAWTYVSTGGALEFLQRKWAGRLGDVLKVDGVFNGPRFARIPCRAPHGVDFLSQRHVFLIRPVFRRIVHPGFSDRLFFVPEGSLLVGGHGTLGEGEIFGRVLYVHGRLTRTAFTQDLLRVQPRADFSAVTYAYLSSHVGFRMLRSTAVGTKLLTMRADLLRNLPFPDCDNRTSEQIAQHLKAATSAREAADEAEHQAIRILEEEVLPTWLS